ncbi:MAG: hypothetical protein KDK36_13240 [Leptospiraceae bacterium]|nr:hypothetical protein [Leptospiraceae bacterium]
MSKDEKEKRTIYLDAQMIKAIEFIQEKRRWAFTQVIAAWLEGVITDEEIKEAKEKANVN